MLDRYARDTTHHSIVYRHSDINTDALRGARCGVSDSSLVEYLERMGRSMTTPEEITPGEGITPESRKKRQSGNSDLVRCDLNVTGDYLFFQEVTREAQGLSLEAREKVAESLLVSYIHGASAIYKVSEGRERGGGPAIKVPKYYAKLC